MGDKIDRDAVLAAVTSGSDNARRKMAACTSRHDQSVWSAVVSHLDITHDAIAALPAAPAEDNATLRTRVEDQATEIARLTRIVQMQPPRDGEDVRAGELKEAIEKERDRCAKIADAFADENIRMAGDTVLHDPVLHTPKGKKLTAADWRKSEEMIVSGAVHSAMFHAAQNIAAAIRGDVALIPEAKP